MKDDLLVQRKIRRPRRLPARKRAGKRTSLHIAQILAWADAWFQRTGRWPGAESGYIPGTTDEKWSGVDTALQKGYRGLPGGSSLARLLAQRRGKRSRSQRPPHTIKRILAWADAHHARTGCWPRLDSGPIADAPGETWMAVGAALKKGVRGLPGGSSLARLLFERRRVRTSYFSPDLSVEQILAWADAWFERTGRWPEAKSGYIPRTTGEKWINVDIGLRQGFRGLPGGSSLALLLAKHRGRPLTIKRILAWADAHHRRTGHWPTWKSGPIEDAAGERWVRVDWALRYGQRGLPRGSSLSRLLARRRGVVKRHRRLPPLSIEQTLSWADAHHRREGRWPQASSGRIAEAPGETWSKIDMALREGRRGLPGGGSLARFLAKYRGVRPGSHWPALSVEQILAWADAHHRRTGDWPTSASGSIHDADGETWNGINVALRNGRRGLVGGSTLPRLLAEHRGVIRYHRRKRGEGGRLQAGGWRKDGRRH